MCKSNYHAGLICMYLHLKLTVMYVNYFSIKLGREKSTENFENTLLSFPVFLFVSPKQKHASFCLQISVRKIFFLLLHSSGRKALVGESGQLETFKWQIPGRLLTVCQASILYLTPYQARADVFSHLLLLIAV